MTDFNWHWPSPYLGCRCIVRLLTLEEWLMTHDADGVRKPHVTIPQDRYLQHLREHGPQTLAELMEALDVSRTTASRKLEGLAYQGRVRRELGANALADRFEVVS